MRRRSDRLQTTASRRRCNRPTSPGGRGICSSATARAVPPRGAPVSVSRTTRNTGYRPTSRFMWSTVTARWRRSNSPLSQAIRLDLPAPTSPEKVRSEEHTSELQSLAYLVCRLLLEKKKKKKKLTNQDGAFNTTH